MRLIDMAGRPGTPSRERLELVDLLMERDFKLQEADPDYTPIWDQPDQFNPAYADVWMLHDYEEIYQFSMDAHDEVERLNSAEQIQENMDILPFAANGSNDKFIGMLIDLGEPDEDDTESDPEEHGIIITCLYRDPDWVGLHEQLRLCKDLEVHVFGYNDAPQEPQVILAVRPGNIEHIEDHPGQTEPQNEINKAIREATMWYGAVSCTFHVSDEDKPQDEDKDEI